MHPFRTTCAVLGILLGTFFAGAPAQGLPDPDQPIDPSKRAPISTRDAVRPSASHPSGTGVVPKKQIPITRASVAERPNAMPKSSIQVSELRGKKTRSPWVRRLPGARKVATRNAADLPASIPRLGTDRFQKILTQYRAGHTLAADLRFTHARRDQEQVGLDDINRFAGPRATLERQGIPVISAGSGPGESAEEAPVPISKQNPSPPP